MSKHCTFKEHMKASDVILLLSMSIRILKKQQLSNSESVEFSPCAESDSGNVKKTNVCMLFSTQMKCRSSAFRQITEQLSASECRLIRASYQYSGLFSERQVAPCSSPQESGCRWTPRTPQHTGLVHGHSDGGQNTGLLHQFKCGRVRVIRLPQLNH